MGNKQRGDDLVKGIRFDKLFNLAISEGTPCLAIDVRKVVESYDEISKSMPGIKIYYAVKACPIPEVILALVKRGSYFDAASKGEIELLLKLGVTGDRISFGNTIKKADAIKFAFENGVNLFTSDDFSDLDDIALYAPGSKINLRLLMDCEGADLGLDKKFGCHTDKVYKLAIYAKKVGLIPYGISFHVGSQQRDIGKWDDALTTVRYFFQNLSSEGINLRCINLGGGLPADYLEPTESINVYCESIMNFIKEDFDIDNLDIIIEPGRSIVANAGIILTEVIRVSTKSMKAKESWVFFDVGFYNGLNEMPHIEFPFYFANRGHQTEKDWQNATFAGPTCCSLDMTPEWCNYTAPKDLKKGEIACILSAGAYTHSLSTISFNGFEPIKVVILGDDIE